METFWKSSSIENCLLELLLNALKAEATAIAVRINASKRRIQVVDNGFGITKNKLRYVGENVGKKEIPETFASSEKNLSIAGKNLIKIRKISSCLIIMSRSCFSSDTYSKVFIDGENLEIRKIESRPVCGTTVTVYTLNNFSGWDEIDSFAIRYIIAYLALANTQVSFSVRDDKSSSILLRIGKRQKYRQLLKTVCERPLSKGEVNFTKISLDHIKIEFFWGFECTNSRKIQQILLNLRPVQCTSLNNFIIKIVRKMSEEKANFSVDEIFFLFYIECSDSEYKLSSKNGQLIVEFYQNDKITDSIRKILTKSDPSESNLSKILNYNQIISPPIIRPTGRILGVKQKRSFMTKVCRQSLENKRNLMKKEDGVKNSSIFKNVDSSLTNGDIGDTFPKLKSLESMMSVKQNVCHDILEATQRNQRYMQKSEKDPDESQSRNGNCEIVDVSQIIQRSVEKSEKESGKLVTILENENQADILSVNDPREYLVRAQNENREDNLPIRIYDCNNHDTSWMNQKCIDKSQNDSRQSLVMMQNKNLDNNLPIRNYDYNNHDISWISEKCIEKSQKITWMSQLCVEKLSVTNKEIFAIDECSQWSNWTYQSVAETAKKTHESDHPIIWTRFRKFLPLNLHALLPRGNVKLIRRDSLENESVPLNFNFKYRFRDLDVRPCTRPTVEIKLKVQSLKSMRVLNQVNKEFIVALTQQDEKRLLVIIDQHAMHERIRYESLLRAYKRDAKNPQFISLTLHRPIVISDLSERNCNLLSINRNLLMQYGLNLSLRNVTTLLIFAVPRCFLKKTFYSDNTKLEIAVRKLLQEILENLINDGSKKFLPLTVHDAIASEACHGAIKFGDPLTPQQCDILVSHWKETDAPNRCAHGRPSVIPLLELSSYQINKSKIAFQKKLNFAALLKSRAHVK